MALYDDLMTAKKTWGELSWAGKSFLILSSFLTLSSVATLSDSVLEFRGFIAEGLDFYLSVVADPLIRVASHAGLSFNSVEVNALIILTLGFAGALRVFLHEGMRGDMQLGLPWGLKGLFLFPVMYLAPILALGLNQIVGWWLYLLAFGLVFFRIPYRIGFLASPNELLTDPTPIEVIEEKRRLKTLILHTGPMILAIVGTFVLAAISSGLSRPIN